MASHTLYMACHLLCMISHLLYVWHRTMYLWHHTQYIYHIISIIYDTTHTAFMTTQPLYLTSHPLYLTSHPLYFCHHTHSVDDITANICMISHPVFMSHPIYSIYENIHSMYDITTLCWWHLTQHMYDISCTTDDITSTLSHPTTVFMMSPPLQAWYHTHRTHSIFVITTSPLISHPLWYDITPTLCVTSYAFYITSHPLLMSSHYSTFDITTSIYETTRVCRAAYSLYMWNHSH